jgi:transposase
MNYDRDFKIQAIQLSDDIGVKKASEQLGIPYHTLADWRWQRAHRGIDSFTGSGHKQLPKDEKDRRIMELEAELREANKANEILKDALGFFASSRKK